MQQEKAYINMKVEVEGKECEFLKFRKHVIVAYTDICAAGRSVATLDLNTFKCHGISSVTLFKFA